MIENKNSLTNEINMLKGNINRMCISDNTIEITDMFEHAYKRLEDIYEYNIKRANDNINMHKQINRG